MFSAKQILDTQNDIFGNILGGASKLLEGIVDFGAGVAGLAGADTQEFIKRDFTQEYVLDPVQKSTQDSAINLMGEKGQRITRGVAQGVGQMLPVVLTGGLATGLGASAGLAQGISLATIGVGAGGGGVETALTEGATQEQAMLYGTAVGALEVATEKLVGGVWDNITGAGIADKVLAKVVRSTNPAVRKGLKLVLDAGGEGVEEMVSEIVEPYIRRATYDKDTDNATMEQVLEAGLIGALTAVTYQGSIGNVIKRKSGAYVNETINDLKALENKENTLWANNRLTAEEQAKIDKQRAYLTKDLQKSVDRLSAKKQASIQEVVKPYLTIDKVASDYVSRGVRASQLEGVQVATELTTEQGVKWDKVKQQHNKLRSLGLVSSELVLADFTDRNIRGMQKDNLVLIDKAELDSEVEILGQKVSKATQTMVHELTHFAEGTKEYEEFSNLAYRTAVASGDLVVADMIKEGIDTKDKVKIQEGVAIFSELIFNESSIERIANANRSFGYKILNRITEVIKKLKGEPTITPILRKAEKLWLKALEKGAKQPTNGVRYSHRDSYYQSEVRVRYAEYLADTLISKTKRGLYSANEIASVLFATDAVIPGKGRLLENLHESFNRKTRAEALKEIDTAIEYIIDRAFLLDTQRSVVVAKASETLNELNESLNTLDLSEVREEIRSKSDKAQTILMRWGKNGGIKATAQQALDLEAKYQEALKEVRRGLRSELTASDTKELRDNLRKGLVEIYDKKYPQEKIINLVEQYQKEVNRLINKIHDIRLYNKEYNKALRSVERLKQKTKHKFGGYLADESLNAWLKDITALTFRDALKTPNILREKIRSFNTIYGNEALSDYRVGEIQEAIDFIIKGEGRFSGLDMQALRIVIDGTNHLYATYKQTYRTVGKEQELFEFEPLLTSSIPEIRETQMGKVGRLEAYMLDPEAVARKLDNYENGINQFWLHEAQQGELRAKVELMKMEKKLIAWKKQNKKHSLERIITLNGKKIPLEIAMSLYMTSLREGAKQGLEKNGWVYYEKNKLVTIEPQGVDKIQAEIQAQLTETDLSLIELINELMETAKKLKVETDMKRLGFTNATEEYYFPIQRFSSVAGIETEYGQTSVNAFSFNKDTTKNILPLKISSVLSVVEEHISGVAMYYGLGTVVDTFNRTYNSRINGTTARLELAKVWSGADSYYKKFLADIQGIDTDSKDQLNRYISIIRSGFATYQLAANPKVLLTQASAVIAGSQKLGLGNVLKGMGHKISFKDMDKYCPFVELRNFDHGAFRSMTVLDKGAVKGKGAKAVDKIRAFTEKLMIGIQYMDRLSIGFLWNGAQQQAVREGYKLGTEENKERAGVILENTVRETQANYVPSERSVMMRSKNEITKFLTMFTADANKLVSRFIDGIGEQRALRKKLKANPNDANIKKRIKTAHNKTVKAISAIITVNLYLTLLAQLFNKFYNRDEEEPLNAFLENFAGNMFGMLPIFRDISGFLIEGYEVDLALTSTINDILKATKSNYEIIEKAMNGENIQEFEVNKNVRDVLYSVGVLFGIPFRNVNNLVYGTTNLISKEAGYKYNAMFYQTYTTDLDKALKEEDYGLAQSIMATMLSRNQMTGDTEKLVKLYEAGHKVLPKTVNDTITVDTVEYELSQSQRKQFYEIYSKANTKDILDSNLPDEAKAYAIRQAYSFYWDSAVEETLGIESKKSLIAKQVDANKLALALGYAETIKGDNRKERIERYLRSKFNRREIKLILDYMGYVVH